MAGKLFKSGQGALFMQRGPNAKPQYLGCHGLSDIPLPEGDLTPLLCPDESAHDKFKTVDVIRGEPGAITATITTDIGSQADAMETLNCPAIFFVHKVHTGRRDVFTNYARTFVLLNARRTQRTLSGLLAADPGQQARSTQPFDFNIEAVLDVWKSRAIRQTTVETQNFRSVSFCNEALCPSENQIGMEPHQRGVAAADGAVGVAANVYFTYNGGASWTVGVADPFGAAENIAAVRCFDYGGRTRYLVARGSTDADDPAEVAYSDDGGATWVTVDVGATDGAYFFGHRSIHVVDSESIWAVTTDGRIYRGTGGGAVWTLVENAVISSAGYRAVHFVDRNTGYIVGDNGIVVSTDDGDAEQPTFTAQAVIPGAGDINSVAVRDYYNAWVITDTGELFYTYNGGDGWLERGFSGSGAGSGRDIAFANDAVGFLAHNNGGGVGTLLKTIDGGFSWEVVQTPTNTGFNGIEIGDYNNAFVAGDAVGGTALMLRVLPIG